MEFNKKRFDYTQAIWFDYFLRGNISKQNLSHFVLLRPCLAISAKMYSIFSFYLMSVIAYLKFKFILNFVLILSGLES